MYVRGNRLIAARSHYLRTAKMDTSVQSGEKNHRWVQFGLELELCWREPEREGGESFRSHENFRLFSRLSRQGEGVRV